MKKSKRDSRQGAEEPAVRQWRRKDISANLEELEKLKKRRIEREQQRQEREDEQSQVQRSKEAIQYEEWNKQEEKFHLEQARLRSKIRIQDGRAKPIDLLAQYISDKNLEDAIEMQMHEPYTYLHGLTIDDLEDLMVDIRVYNDLEKSAHSDYWADITIIVEDELKKLKKLEVNKGEYRVAVGRREGIHQSVAKDVTEIFRGKTTTQLNELKGKIEHKINNQTDGVDVGYWESLLSQLKAHMARSRLRDKHQDNLKMKLLMLKQEQELSAGMKKERESDDEEKKEPEPSSSKVDQNDDSQDASNPPQEDDDEEGDLETDLLQECFQLYHRGCYSPKYLKESDLEPGMDIISEARDEEKLNMVRRKVLEQEEEPTSKDDLKMRKEARQGMNDDEVEFSVETKLDSQIYLWSDKYRPRKPRYFNRVHTGFEWNKYNQTHYDIDNPPPKIVQGYKFNIFYPDLIEKGVTPQYFLTPCADNADFATLRFHVGPPYEDIAFKIVNREWEFSYKRGFRCQFQNNIFQLWFHFKRYRYRR